MDHKGTPRRGLLHRAARVTAFCVLVTAGAVAHAQARPPLPTVATNANQESMALAITTLCPNLRRTYIATGGLMPGDQIDLFDACAGTGTGAAPDYGGTVSCAATGSNTCYMDIEFTAPSGNEIVCSNVFIPIP